MKGNPYEHPHIDQSDLDSDIEDYLRDKERIRKILGKVGGMPQKKERIINYAFFVLVAVSFTIGICVGDRQNVFLDVAILLVSMKLIYVVGQTMKINHFQFWMLSTLEWRLNEMGKDLRALEKKLSSQRDE